LHELKGRIFPAFFFGRKSGGRGLENGGKYTDIGFNSVSDENCQGRLKMPLLLR
jgi:hypothetical protein